ncbi:hypothetical protein CAEBREN_01858 [Caenorhabditis brenneri]|uniref:DNA-directed DNA polymerase n=1 Tax=Caenorhabditis brenneri TaxID=135651 RepID=G0MUS9_CAEBE|nr:hypothetical protein CAEBREN_01858 [Caenorhabditis brenneri]
MKEHIIFEYEPKFLYRNEKRVSLPEMRLRFKNKVNSPEIMQRTLDQFIRYCIGKSGGDLETSKMSFGFFHQGFHAEKGFWINERVYETFNGQVLFEELERITQSKEDIDIDDTFMVTMHVFNNFKGTGGPFNRYFDEQLKVKAHVAGSGKCLPKAVALGMAFLAFKQEKDEYQKKEKQLLWQKLIAKKYNTSVLLQSEAADNVLKKANLSIMEQSFDLNDLERIAAVFPEYKFEVYNRPSYEKLYHLIKEFNKDADKIITIGFKKDNGEGHYDFIKPSLLYMKTTYCHKCKKKTLSTGHSQVCEAKCDKCGFYDCDKTQIESILCDECNTNFPNEDCFNRHLETAYNSKKAMCQKRYTCLLCNFRVCTDKVAQDEVHECDKQSRCGQCKQKFDKSVPHNCCFEPPRKKLRESTKEKQQKYTIICYDVESIVTNSPNGPDPTKPQPKHTVNLICYKMCCDKCIERKTACSCESGNFGYTQYAEPLEMFTEFLLYNPKLNGAYVIAHNGGRYDHNFILSIMMKRFHIIPEYVSNGTSLIMANIIKRRSSDVFNDLKFRDSLRYIPMPLSKMPKTFGIVEMKKGYYPYYFNHPENYGKRLIGLPDKHFYDPNHMKSEALVEFEKWYDEHKFDTFIADQEILEYCQNDVEILTAGLSEYIKVCFLSIVAKNFFLQICKKLFKGWNPILSSCTIASFVKHILKFEHFTKGDLGIIPENGFPERNNSVFALKMLMWIEKKFGVTIQHKLRGPEKKLKMTNGQCFFVDGFDEQTNTVYEIHGCFYHGCPQCTNPTMIHPLRPGVENKAVYDSTIQREECIRQAGYNLISLWEHEIRDLLRKDSSMRTFFEKCRHATHLIPRDGMYGGRTQPFQMIVECNQDEECRYDDFNSLYPSVNIMYKYPRGQPKLIKKEFPRIIPGELMTKKGLYFCSVIAPTDIKIPVLPYKIPGYLTFPSCRSCIENNQNLACIHDKVTQRYLTGVWTHVELNTAIERGYRVLKFHEIWWWPDNEWVEADYFVNYLKPMIQLKHESSGWPRDDMSMEEKQKYIELIKQRDGVELDLENVRKADNMREMAKLFLNTCWGMLLKNFKFYKFHLGKFAENPIKHESKLFETLDHGSQSDYMDDQNYEVTGIKDWDEGITLITRKAKIESVLTKEFTNVVIGIYTTSYARLRLLQAMEAVGSENLIYVDTDSVIYKKKISDPNPVEQLIGDGLGKLKSEIPNGYRMKKIVSMASKVYSYCLENVQTLEEKIVTKFKGVVLNTSTERVINMSVMEKSVRDYLAGHVETLSAPDRTMRRSQILGDVTTTPSFKKLKPVMDKIRVLPDGKTLPCGYYPNCQLVDDFPY